MTPSAGADKAFHYSVTIKTSNLSVVCCLRGLAFCAERHQYKMKSVGHAREDDWAAQQGEVTFRFTRAEYREIMLTNASQLLVMGTWEKVSESDSDPIP
jgi:hypothetical protein